MEELKVVRRKIVTHSLSCSNEIKKHKVFLEKFIKKLTFLKLITDEKSRVKKAIDKVNKKNTEKNTNTALRKIDNYVEMVEIVLSELDEMVDNFDGDLKIQSQQIEKDLKTFKLSKFAPALVSIERLSRLSKKTIEAGESFEEVENIVEKYKIITRTKEGMVIDEFKAERKTIFENSQASER